MSGALDYMSRFVAQVVPALKNGLTFADNFNCKVATVTLRNNVAQKLKVDKPVIGVFVIRVGSTTYGFTSLTWYYDSSGSLTVKVGFSGSPSADAQIDATIVILYE
jgi:hypothetical protein